MRALRIVTTALVAAVVVAGCGSSGTESDGGGSDGGDTIKLGYAAALTGYLAGFDTPFHEALKVAIDEKNADGGLDGKYQIELQTKDVKSEIPTAAQISQELVDDGSDVLITPCDADPSISAGQSAQAAQIPAISSCGGSPQLPGAVGDYMFQNVFALNSQVVPLAQYAYEDKGYRSAYVLYAPDTRYTNDGPLHFAEVFEELGGEIVGKETYKFQNPDFGAQITKIRQANPDVIMTSAYDPDLSAFLKQLRGAGIDTPVLGTDGADAPSLLKSAGKAGEGFTFSTHGIDDPDVPKVAKFAEAYREATGNDPESGFVYAAPDLIAVLDAAVKETGSLDGPVLRDAIDGLEDVEGTTGPITYAGTGRSPLKTVYIVTIENGKFVLVQQGRPEPDLIPAPIGEE